MSKHALFAPSSAHRWLACGLSIYLEHGITSDKQLTELLNNGVVDESAPSPYAIEGSLAHDIADKVLRGELKPEEIKDPELRSYISAYVDYVRGLGGVCFSELPLQVTHFAPGVFGTCDALVINGDKLHIVDFKYGQGVRVEAKDNPQLLLYALGALNFAFLFNSFEEVTLHIFQPRMDNVQSWTVGFTWLIDYGFKLRRRVEEIIKKKNITAQPGEHCRFCKAAAICRKRSEKAMDIIQYTNQAPERLTDEELLKIYEITPQIEAFLKAVNNHIIGKALAGQSFPGFKLVEGRSRRVVANEDALVATLTAGGADEALLYEKKLIGITRLSAIFGKEKMEELEAAGIIASVAGKPTLVKESDSRPSLNLAAELFEDLGEEDKKSIKEE